MITPDRDRAAIIEQGFESTKRWGIRFIVLAIVAWLLAWIIDKLWVALFPLAIALILATLLSPIAGWLRAKKVPGALASLLALILGLVVFGGVITALVPQVIEQAPQLAESVVDGLNAVKRWLLEGPFGFSAEQINAATQALQDKVMESATLIGSSAVSTISAITNFFVTIVLIVMLTFFLINDGHRFVPWLRKVLGPHAGMHATEVLNRSWVTLGAFIRAQAVVATIDAVIIGTALLIVDQPLWIPLAVITFFGAFIPIIGAFVSGVLAVLVTLVTNDFTTAVIVAVVVLIVQQLEGNVLSPLLQGKYVQLPAAVVLLAVVIGGSQFGIAGAFLAIPVVASAAGALRYLSEQIELKVLAEEVSLDED